MSSLAGNYISDVALAGFSRHDCLILSWRIFAAIYSMGILVVRKLFKALVLVGVVLTMAGCSFLPRSGPDDGAIAKGASATLFDTTGHAPSYQYAIVDLTKDVVSYVTKDDPGSLLTTFGGGKGAAPKILVGVGDIIQVTVFESQTGGLFIPDDAGARPGNYVTFPAQTVDLSGFITVPYAGSVRALGQSIPDIEAEIVSRLLDQAIEPQVSVAMIEQNATTATVAGSVSSPGRLPITGSGDRVVDIIARAGGLAFPDYESFVTLTRRGKSRTVFFPNLVRSPGENIFVAPNDTIYVYREQRRFIAFGASGQVGEFEFEREQLKLTEAVAKMGGLLDDQADPSQVMLYRMESRTALENMGVDLSNISSTAKKIPTIYRANFRKPDSFFLSAKFQMNGGDVVYVSNADAIELVKFLDVLSSVTGTVSGTASDVNSTRVSVEAVVN